jgi:hypothetical protein
MDFPLFFMAISNEFCYLLYFLYQKIKGPILFFLKGKGSYSEQ